MLAQFSKEDVENMEAVRDHIHDLSIRVNSENLDISSTDDVTLHDFVKNLGTTTRTQETVNIWARVMLGVEANAISARCFIDYAAKGGGLMQMRSDKKHGGQYLRFRTGTQSVAKGIASLLPAGSIRLSHPVKSLTNLGQTGISITTLNGQIFTSRKAILAVPTPLYKNITISPPLAGPKLKAVSSTKLGFYTKVIACYSSPWWREAGSCGLALSFHGPVIVARDTSVDVDGQFSLTCFVNGDVGAAWAKLPQHERRTQVLSHIDTMFDGGRRGHALLPIEVFEQIWRDEEWFEGAVCPVTGPGVLNEAGAVMGEKVGNLSFVGTEFAAEWKGYMEGAVCSGEEGAKEVIRALGREVSVRVKL